MDFRQPMRQAGCRALLILVASCGALAPAIAAQDDQGAVYTMTNDPGANAVLAFSRSHDGSLTPAGTFFTGGRGTGGKEPDFGLLNARPLVLNEDNKLLLVVNPGSDDVSVFAVERDTLRLLDRQSSGGHRPVSVTVHNGLVYVLNAGGSDGGTDNISGFTVAPSGTLKPLATRPGLSAPRRPVRPK